MRILLVHPGPDFSVHDVWAGWLEAFRELGVQAESYMSNDRLVFYSKALLDTGEKDEYGLPIVRQAMTQDQAFTAAMQGLTHALYTFWPDVVMFISAFFTTAGTFSVIRKRRHKIIILATESPYQDDEQLERGQFADLSLLNDPANLGMYDQVGVPAVYMPHAYRPSVHYPRAGPPDPAKASDLAFIGTAFRSRVEFFGKMDLSGVDALLGGNYWGEIDPASPLAPYVGSGLGNPDCVDNAQTAEIYRNAKIGINFYRREAEDAHVNDVAIAMSPREVEMAACGLPFLRDPRPEGDRVLSMLPAFTSPEDASEQLRWWLSHDREREKAASLAREAIADRTFENNAKRLLTMLEGL